MVRWVLWPPPAARAKTRSRCKWNGTKAAGSSGEFNEERRARELTGCDSHTGPWISRLATEKSEEINDSERVAVGRMDLSSVL